VIFIGIILTIIFLVLQCNGIVAWEWYAIISPLLIAVILKIIKWIVLLIIGIVAMIAVSKE
jgi:hypothetical protein